MHMQDRGVAVYPNSLRYTCVVSKATVEASHDILSLAIASIIIFIIHMPCIDQLQFSLPKTIGVVSITRCTSANHL